MGVTTAHALWRDGHEPIVLERAQHPAAETSHANAGLIAASRALPWPAPGALRELWLAVRGRSAALKITQPLDATLIRWGGEFLAYANNKDYARLSAAKLGFARWCQQRLEAWLTETGIDCGYRRRGLLHLCSSPASERALRERAQWVAGFGARMDWLEPAELGALEPSLRAACTAGELIGAGYSPEDAEGDARLFTVALAERLQAAGVAFHFGVAVEAVASQERRLTELILADGRRLACDAAVVALGPWTPVWARRLGWRIPIYPVKGFSITVPVRHPADAPSRGGLCEDTRVAFCPLEEGRWMRLTTGAVFAGWDTSFSAGDFLLHRTTADRLWPGLLDWDSPEARHWACLRPMTPSSLPILQAYGFDNLWWNCGQGHIGWTMSAGSAEVIAALIAGREPPFALRDMQRID